LLLFSHVTLLSAEKKVKNKNQSLITNRVIRYLQILSRGEILWTRNLAKNKLDEKKNISSEIHFREC